MVAIWTMRHGGGMLFLVDILKWLVLSQLICFKTILVNTIS